MNIKFVDFKCGDIHTSKVYFIFFIPDRTMTIQNYINYIQFGERQCKLKKKFFLFDMIKINFFQTYFNSLLIELEKKTMLVSKNKT